MIDKCELSLKHIHRHEHTLPGMSSTPEQLRFASIPAHRVRADFAGGGLSSDLGPVLLRGIDLQISRAKPISTFVKIRSVPDTAAF